VEKVELQRGSSRIRRSSEVDKKKIAYSRAVEIAYWIGGDPARRSIGEEKRIRWGGERELPRRSMYPSLASYFLVAKMKKGNSAEGFGRKGQKDRKKVIAKKGISKAHDATFLRKKTRWSVKEIRKNIA